MSPETQAVPPAAPGLNLDDEQLWAFAQRLAPAKFLPDYLRNDPASVFYLLATGQEMGVGRMHSTRSYFRNREGGLGMKGDIMLGLLLLNKFDVKFDFTDVGCTCTITRPDNGKSESRTFTMEDAATIQTRWDPTGGPDHQGRWLTLAEDFYYRNHPKTMCQWRSLAMCGRVIAADLIGGLYLPDEIAEAPAEQAAPPAEANGKASAASAAEEFVVGEKEEPPAAEEAQQESVIAEDPAPPPAEQVKPPEQPEKTEQPEAPAASAEAQPEKKPAAKPAPVIEYSIRVVTKDEKGVYVKTPISEPAQPSRETAVLIARAQANKTKLPHILVKVVDGVDTDELDVCNPPSDPLPAPAERVKSDGELFDDLVNGFLKKIGGDTKASGKMITAFFLGYLGLQAGCPKDKSKLLPLAQKLNEVIDTRMEDLKANARKLGAELANPAANKGLLQQRFEQLGWSPEICALALQAKAQANQTDDAFLTWIDVPMAGGGGADGPSVSISQMEPLALEVFFPLFLLAKGRAFEAVDFAIANKENIADTLQGMVTAAGKPVSEWSTDFAIGVLEVMANMKNAAPAPAAAATEEDNWADGGLPFSE